MDDYVSKPIEAAKLFDVIEAAVKQSHLAREQVRPDTKTEIQQQTEELETLEGVSLS